MESNFLEVVGFVGALCLSFCSIPQLVKTIRTKETASFDIYYLWLWFFGVLLMFFYVFYTTFQIPLLLNYGLNTFIVAVILYYYYKYR